MNKQGVAYWQLILVFYLIVALVVVATLGLKAKYVLSDEEYADAYSKITALTINSMLYSDYDTQVILDIPSFFEIEILDNKVRISLDGTEKEYDYIPDNNFKISFEREGHKLILKKARR